jgi:hypothetical protein
MSFDKQAEASVREEMHKLIGYDQALKRLWKDHPDMEDWIRDQYGELFQRQQELVAFRNLTR